MGNSRIDYLTRAWNYYTGCLHTQQECPTADKCYASLSVPRFPALFGPDFRPRLHLNRLTEPMKWREPQRVGVCFQGDLFGAWMDDDPALDKSREQILDVVRQTPQHTYLFLTKNPGQLREFNPWPANAWVGASVCTQAMVGPAVEALADVEAKVRWLSVEPLLERVTLGSGAYPAFNWVVEGAQTGPGAVKPQSEWVVSILNWVSGRQIPVYMKRNLRPVMGPDYELRQEWPEVPK